MAILEILSVFINMIMYLICLLTYWTVGSPYFQRGGGGGCTRLVSLLVTKGSVLNTHPSPRVASQRASLWTHRQRPVCLCFCWLDRFMDRFMNHFMNRFMNRKTKRVYRRSTLHHCPIIPSPDSLVSGTSKAIICSCTFLTNSSRLFNVNVKTNLKKSFISCSIQLNSRSLVIFLQKQKSNTQKL